MKHSGHSEVVAHYQAANEEERLQTSHGKLEEARTKRIIESHLASTHRRAVDIGGGTGPYSFWLAARGLEVSLLDPVARHIELVRERAERARSGDTELASLASLASIDLGDALDLPYDDASFDIALMMGPLYHLIEPAARIAAIREAMRVLTPGGLLFGVGIGRYASLLIEGLAMGFVDDDEYLAIVEHNLATGVHRNDNNRAQFFTTAVFLLPETLEAEVAAAGMSVVDTVAIEGPGWLAKDFDARWSDEQRRGTLLRLIETVAAERPLLPLSPHFMVVARKG